MIQCDVIFSSSELNAIGDDALVGTTRSIELLRTIDNAIAQLCYDQNFFQPITILPINTFKKQLGNCGALLFSLAACKELCEEAVSKSLILFINS